jgi:hypothetical protein
MTVKELKEKLENYDDDLPVVRRPNGYSPTDFQEVKSLILCASGDTLVLEVY